MPTRQEMEFPLDFVAEQLATAVGGQTEPRAEGWHVSSLIRAAAELAKGNSVEPKDYYHVSDTLDADPEAGDTFDEATLGMMNMGRLWEEAVRPAVAQWCGGRFGYVAQGPQQSVLDSIVANVDGLVVNPVDNTVVAVLECKFRFTHLTDPLKQDHWMRQVKAYCKIWGTVSVWMVVGNVRFRPPTAASRVYLLTFAQGEIDDNWQYLANARDYLERVKQSLIAPARPAEATLAPAFVLAAEEFCRHFTTIRCQDTVGCLVTNPADPSRLVCARALEAQAAGPATYSLIPIDDEGGDTEVDEQGFANYPEAAPWDDLSSAAHQHTFKLIPVDTGEVFCSEPAANHYGFAEVNCDCGVRLCRSCFFDVQTQPSLVAAGEGAGIP